MLMLFVVFFRIGISIDLRLALVGAPVHLVSTEEPSKTRPLLFRFRRRIYVEFNDMPTKNFGHFQRQPKL